MSSLQISRREVLAWIGGGFATAFGACSRTTVPTAPELRSALTVRVTSEFGKLRLAIAHDGGNAADITMDDYRRLVPSEELARHPESGPSSRDRLVEQHGLFRALLADHGVVLVPPKPQTGARYQVFTRDPCFAIGETLFISALRDDWRCLEVDGLRDILARLARVTDLSGPGGVIEGGDILVLGGGTRVLIGTNQRTTAGGFRKLSDSLAGCGFYPCCDWPVIAASILND